MSPVNDQFRQIQDEEVEVLKAIYMDDFQSINQPISAWNKSPDPTFTITLRASSSGQNNTGDILVTVRVIMTATYPKSLPIITVEQTKGLSNKQLDVIKQLITKTTKGHEGQEMIFEVTSAIQDQLENYQIMSENTDSLEQERLNRIKQEEERQRKEHELQLLQEQEKQLEEARMLDQMVQDELSRRKQRGDTEFNSNSQSDILTAANAHSSTDQDVILPDKDSDGSSSKDVVVFDRVITIRHYKGTARFRAVTGKVPTPSHFFGTNYIVKPLCANEDDADLQLLLCEVEFTEPFWSSNEGSKLFKGLESDLNTLKTLIRHPNIACIYDWKIEDLPSGGWKLCILIEHAPMGNLSDLLDAIDNVSLKVARNWAIQILEALEAIHKAGLSHKSLHLENILLSRNREIGETLVKVTNISIAFRLMEMNSLHPFSKLALPTLDLYSSAAWPSSEEEKLQLSKKTDIWRFGVILAEMVSGKSIVNEFQTARDYASSELVPDLLGEFFYKIFKENPKKRPTAMDLLTSKFLRADTRMLLPSSMNNNNNSIISDNVEHSIGGSESQQPLPLSSRIPRSNSNNINKLLVGSPNSNYLNQFRNRGRSRSRGTSGRTEAKYSRYMNDFDEGVVLGRGGYGEVVKVRNKLDGRAYAIKKVRSDPDKLSDILNEVWLLSRLNNQYVVRYFTAWVEEDYLPPSIQDETDDGEVERNDRSSNLDPSVSLSLGFSEMSMDYVSSSRNQYPEIEFGYDTDEEDDDDDYAVSETSHGSRDNPDINVSTYSDDEDSDTSLPQSPRKTASSRRASFRGRQISTLFIQMEYCEKHTLADLIKDGLCAHPDEYWRLTRQIVEALSYIHQEGVIHRDLKPVNIFIDNAQNIKIGDFGLAKSISISTASGTTTRLEPGSKSNNNADDDTMTGDVGTTLYVAIEMTKLGEVKYDSKADMYSLGIIMFEMVYQMQTGMERVSKIKEIRQNPEAFPEDFKKDKEKQIIRSLLDHTPSNRPSAKGLLQSGLIPLPEQDEKVKEVLKTMMDTESPWFYQVCSALFDRQVPAARDVLYDRNIQALGEAALGRKIYGPTRALMEKGVLQAISNVMELYGAVPNTERSALFPKCVLYDENVVKVMDTAGNILQLPYDLTLPFARRLAQRVPTFNKSYFAGEVYRVDDKNPGSHPKSFTQMSFDFVSTEITDLTFNEAETIKILDTLGSILPCYKQSNMAIYINHEDILNEILDYCRFTIPQRSAALLFLGPTGQAPADDKVLNSMLSTHNIPSVSLKGLEEFGFRDELDKAEQKIRKLMTRGEPSRRFKEAITKLRMVNAVLDRLGMNHKVFLAPLSNHNVTFYKNGLMFQLVLEDGLSTKARSKLRLPVQGKPSIIATGGRYDKLVDIFRHASLDGTQAVNAVGFTLAVSIVTDNMMTYWESKKKKPKNSSKTSSSNSSTLAGLKARCDVLVGSVSAAQIRTIGIDVIRILREEGISADLVQESYSSDRLTTIAESERANWIVLIKQTNAYTTPESFKLLRVRNVTTKSETDLNTSDLVKFLQQEIQEASVKGYAFSNSVETFFPLSKLRHVTISSLPGSMSSAIPGGISNAISDLQAGVGGSGSSEGSASLSSNAIMSSSTNNKITVISDGQLKGGKKNRWALEQDCQAAVGKFVNDISNCPVYCIDVKDEVLTAIAATEPSDPDEWRRKVGGLSPKKRDYLSTVQAAIAKEQVRGTSKVILYSLKTGNTCIYELQ